MSASGWLDVNAMALVWSPKPIKMNSFLDNSETIVLVSATS
jgi:hypothetical protein